jgi:hypothetical protein
MWYYEIADRRGVLETSEPIYESRTRRRWPDIAA